MNRRHLSSEEPYLAARELAASDRYTDAILAYSSAIERDPSHIAARVGRGMAFQRIGGHTKAIADFGEVISSYPNWPGVFVAYYSRAVSRQALGQHIEAIKDCDEAVNRNPELTDAFFLRGTVQKALGRIDGAVSDMDVVLAVDPSYYKAYLERGKLYCLQHYWEQAVADLTMAIEHIADGSPNARDCFYWRGVSAQELGKHPEAIADFARAIEMAPDDATAYMRRSRSYNEIGELALAGADLQMGARLMRDQ